MRHDSPAGNSMCLQHVVGHEVPTLIGRERCTPLLRQMAAFATIDWFVFLRRAAP